MTINQAAPPPACSAAADNPAPSYGKPITPTTGTERYTVDLGPDVAWPALALTYDTSRRAPLIDQAAGARGSDMPPLPFRVFDELWSLQPFKSLSIGTDFSTGANTVQHPVVRASRGDGRIVSFTGDGAGNFAASAESPDQLRGTSSGYRYIDAAARSIESYNTTGQLTRIDRADGRWVTYSYSTSATSVAPAAGYLLQLADSFGHTLNFEYALTGGAMTRIVGGGGAAVALGYDAASGHLNLLTWPDAKTRQFAYGQNAPAWALTGITDENQQGYASIGYDALGRATSTQLAGGADGYSVNWATPPGIVVSDAYDASNDVVIRTRQWQSAVGTVLTLPTGATSSLGTTSVYGMPHLTAQGQAAGSGCGVSSSALSYDTNGNIASSDDFNGHRSCRAYDGQHRETTRIEGLTTSATCSAVTPANATLPAGSRKTSTQWHPDWRLAVKLAEPGRLTTSVYNGQPDPFNNNAIASCAPSTAVLPDGKPIAVLCKQVEQATTDTDGHLGFSAALQSSVPNRVQSWTYNQNGQVLTETDPLGNITTSTYYTDTVFTGADPNAVGHSVGDLKTVKNAKGQLTQYTQYDKAGQVLTSIDANNVTTTSTYDARQRLKKVTQPDASYVAYGYDAAHRLTDVSDGLGNSVHYTLDPLGHRTAESVKDPGGTLRRSLTRSIDALGRVQQTTGIQ